MPYACVIATPIGKIGIQIEHAKLVKLEFLSPQAKLLKPTLPLAKVVIAQIQQYFADAKFRFKLPIELVGTELQRKIWRELQKIPVGKVATYKDLANKLHTNPRVIGNACRANPLPLIVPCHRVVAVNGLGGFAGKTSGAKILLKQQLLLREGVCSNRT